MMACKAALWKSDGDFEAARRLLHLDHGNDDPEEVEPAV